MRKIEQWKVFVFIGALSAIALVINLSRKPEFRPTQIEYVSRAPNVSVSAPLSEPVETKAIVPPQPTRILIWPADVTPTKIVRIPDPENPASGVMDFAVRPGDDLQFEIQPWWGIFYDPTSTSEKIENASNEGDGYKVDKEIEAIHRQIQESGGTWLSKQRTVRFRLKPGTTGEVPLRLIVNKSSPEDFKPLPPVPPEKFSNLLVHYKSLQPSRDGYDYTAALDFENTSKTESIAVAAHDDGNELNAIAPRLADIVTSLMSSTGTPFYYDGITGLNRMLVNPMNLTEISPNETRHVLIRYRSNSGLSQRPRSFRLQLDLILNSHYQSADYLDYRLPGAKVLPPGCKLENVVFEIPVK